MNCQQYFQLTQYVIPLCGDYCRDDRYRIIVLKKERKWELRPLQEIGYKAQPGGIHCGMLWRLRKQLVSKKFLGVDFIKYAQSISFRFYRPCENGNHRLQRLLSTEKTWGTYK